jgi:ABC-type polysaccharide/polyol phosphate export permease
VSASATLTAKARHGLTRDWLRLGHHRDVAFHLVRLELAARHRDTLLGWIWSLTPPLLQLAATYFVFTRVIPLDVEDYPIFLLVGILSWSWFSRSLNQATTALESRRDLVLHPGFSLGLLPLTAVLVGFVDYLLAMPVLFVALALTTGIRLESLLLPPLLAIQFVFILGLGLVFAPLQVFLRDVRQFVAMAIAIGFWITPVFYRATSVPEQFQWIYDINPMAYLISSQRAVLLGEGPSGPGVVTMTWVAIASFGVLVLGYAIFARCRDAVPERL